MSHPAAERISYGTGEDKKAGGNAQAGAREGGAEIPSAKSHPTCPIPPPATTAFI